MIYTKTFNSTIILIYQHHRRPLIAEFIAIKMTQTSISRKIALLLQLSTNTTHFCYSVAQQVSTLIFGSVLSDITLVSTGFTDLL